MFYLKSTLRRNLFIVLLSVLILSAGLFAFSFSWNKTASAEETDNTNSLHKEFYYAESAHSAGYIFNDDFITDLDNSVKVVSKTYYIQIAEKTYNQLSDNYNHLVVSWGRKSEMDILANACKSDSTAGDPSFYADVDAMYYREIISKKTDIQMLGNYTLYSDFLSVVKFPYVGYRVSKSSIVKRNVSVAGIPVSFSSYFVPITVSWKAGELFDIGILLTYQYSSTFSKDTRINGYWTDSTVVETIQNRVSHASSYDQNTAGAYEKALGIYRGGNTMVNYSYIKMLDGHFNKYEVLTDSVLVPSVYVPDEEFVSSLVENSDYAAGNGLVGYNANYVSKAGYLMENGHITEVETFGSKIIRQATGFNYSYVFGQTIPATVSCNVAYSDYKYSDFFIKIANSGNSEDSEVEGYYANELNIDVYPTSVSHINGKYYMCFDYNTIFDLFGSTLHWSVQREYFNLAYDSADIKPHVYVEEETLDGDNKRLVVSFDEGYEANLFGLEIVGTAPITESTTFDCYVEYKKLNEDLTFTTKTFYAGQYDDNNFIALNSTLIDSDGTFADKIYGSLNAEILGGIEYVRPVSVVHVSDYMTGTAIFQVNYAYNTSVLVVGNDVNSEKWVFSLSDDIAEHTLELLGVKNKLPAGYRIKSFTGNRFYITEENAGNPLKTKFVKRDSSVSEPYSISLELSDKWPVHINYLKQYKDSCFAEMKEFTGNIRVADYADIFALTTADLNAIMGKSIDVLTFLKKSVRISDIIVSYDEDADSYTVDLAYTYLSVRTINSSGHFEEMKVGLTPFSVWCEYFGRDWSILYLAPDVFKYSDEVDTDKLYGFFSTITFQEKVSDLSVWFKKQTGQGCCTVFSESKVKGSDFYKFLRKTTGLFTTAGTIIGGLMGGHFLTGAAIGTAAQYGLENIAEYIDDSAGTYYTYFFYLDGNSDLAYFSHSGARSYDDDGSAFENFFKRIGDKIKSFWDDILSSPIMTVLAIIVAVIAGVFVIAFVIKGLIWIFQRKG